MVRTACAPWLVMLGLWGCGRIGFDPLGTRGTNDAGAAADSDLTSAPANRVFVTSALFDGNLGGLAGADAKCAAAAATAGLTGTFIAWLSTNSVNAVDRFAGSRGWRRTDGVPVADQLAAAFATGTMFTMIDRDEHGVRISYANAGGWSGSGPDGALFTNTVLTCTDWTDNTTGNGWLGDFSAAGPSFSWANSGAACSEAYHLACFEIGLDVPTAVPSQPLSGRIAFVSGARTVAGLAPLDTLCANDAAAAGLPGTYLAAVATTTKSIASRFAFDARPIQRVDGTIVATTAAGLLGTTDLLAPVNQHADGSFFTDLMWTGAGTPNVVGTLPDTCNNWTDLTINGGGRLGDPASAATVKFWGNYFNGAYGGVACSFAQPVLCLEQ